MWCIEWRSAVAVPEAFSSVPSPGSPQSCLSLSASDGVSLSRDPWVITSAGHAHVRVLASLAADLWLHPDSEAVGSARLVASMRLLRDGRGPVAP